MSFNSTWNTYLYLSCVINPAGNYRAIVVFVAHPVNIYVPYVDIETPNINYGSN